MAKQKQRSKRYMVSVNAMEQAALEKLMREDNKTEVSSYFGCLITEVSKARAEKTNNSPAGRAKTKETEDERATRIMAEPKDTPHPDQGDAFCGHNGMMVSRREAEDWCGWIDENEEKRAWAQALPYYIPKAQRIVKD